jgi:4-hydroxy-3-polyprenylbenzoate decarboxylase
MGFQDLRDWLEQVDAIGQLTRVEGIDWDLELGTLASLSYKRPLGQRKALLFDKIKGHAPGYRVLTDALGSVERLALTTGVTGAHEPMDFVRAWRTRRPRFQSLPPVEVEDGPVLENVQCGTDVDLEQFPVPRWHEHDGGRYIGTGACSITRDPGAGWINLGTYRVMLHDRSSVGWYVSPAHHGFIHRTGYWERGEPMPIAITFGQDPLLTLAASTEVPFGESEYDWAGGVRGCPYQVVRGPATGLPIPARAEIAIEGEVVAGEVREEGPFGEWTGYYASGSRSEPVIRVKTLMWRNDPILYGVAPGRPPHEGSTYRALLTAASIWDELERSGVPGIQGVWRMQPGGGRLWTTIAIKQLYAGHAKQALLAAAAALNNYYMNRYVVVVDEDIDPTDTDEVIWAMLTRGDPARAVEIIRECVSSPLDPALPPGEKAYSSRLLVNACRPYEWRDRFPPVAEPSRELAERVRAKWAHVLAD